MNNTDFYPNRHGGLGLYAIILIIVGLGLALFVFMPEYTEVQNGIYNVSCEDIRAKIQSAVDDYNVNNSKSYGKPNLVVDLDTLKEKGYLREIKLCPQKGVYMFDKNNKVICSIHTKGQTK